MKLIIKGNKEFYQLNNQVDIIEVSLEGRFKYDSDSQVLFTLDDRRFIFENSSTLLKFSEDIRGKSKEAMILTLIKINKESDLLDYLEELSQKSINLIKSIFLLFHWLDLPLHNPSDLEIESNIYDNFVVDWTFRPESQKDIYLISRNHITDPNQIYINKLIELNLLASFRILGYKGRELQCYFTPLSIPGVSKENFQFDNFSAYPLWQKILKDRDKRISNWVNNRY